MVGIDGSEGSHAALRWAVGQAARTGASVRAVIAWEYPSTYGWVGAMYPGDQGLATWSQQVLLEAVHTVLGDNPPVVVETVVVEGQSVRVLLDESKGADLLVVGSRGRGGFAGLLLGSVSQHCVQHARCPVVVIPPPEAGDRG